MILCQIIAIMLNPLVSGQCKPTIFQVSGWQKLISIKISFINRSTGDIVATGGRGDKCIFVYQSDSDGKFKRLQKLQGHQGKSQIYARLNIINIV